ncbi:MAG: hypothetical protein O7C75_04590 [Verrucomicrobia bacterium]|nr:hypothetical protein [Verrucomicrobiota bacterium]
MKENEIAGLAKAFEQKLIQGPKNPVPEFILEDIRKRKEPEIEMRFSVGDRYSKKLFIALARKKGFKPYRYPRQKHTTVILKGKKSYFDLVLWPEFIELSGELEFFLEQLTNEIVRNVLTDDFSEITVPSSENSSQSQQ